MMALNPIDDYEDELNVAALKKLILESTRNPSSPNQLLVLKDLKDKIFTVLNRDFQFKTNAKEDAALVGTISKEKGEVTDHKNRIIGKVHFNDGLIETTTSGIVALITSEGSVKNMVGTTQVKIHEGTIRNKNNQIVARVEGLGKSPPLLPLILLGCYVVFFNPLHRVNVNHFYKKPSPKQMTKDYLLVFDKDCLSTGIDIVDDQHRKLFDIYNVVADVMLQAGEDASAAQTPEKLEKIVEALRRYTEYHFNTEESLFNYVHFPPQDAAKHQCEHQEFIRKVSQISVEVTNSQSGSYPKYSLRMRRSFNHALGSTALNPKPTTPTASSSLSTEKIHSSPSDLTLHLKAAEEEQYYSTFFDILLFLRKWLLEHTGGLDQLFAQFIRHNAIDIQPWVDTEGVRFQQMMQDDLVGL